MGQNDSTKGPQVFFVLSMNQGNPILGLPDF